MSTRKKIAPEVTYEEMVRGIVASVQFHENGGYQVEMGQLLLDARDKYNAIRNLGLRIIGCEVVPDDERPDNYGSHSYPRLKITRVLRVHFNVDTAVAATQTIDRNAEPEEYNALVAAAEKERQERVAEEQAEHARQMRLASLPGHR